MQIGKGIQLEIVEETWNRDWTSLLNYKEDQFLNAVGYLMTPQIHVNSTTQILKYFNESLRHLEQLIFMLRSIRGQIIEISLTQFYISRPNTLF